MDGVVSAAVYLELLAREAPVVEYERPLVEARARGAAADVIAELERAKLLALRVRGVLERRRQREAELSALFDTAGDLSALQDVDAVLRAIVRRARRLLGTDVAYLTLKDAAAGDTYMRVTDGSVSAQFQRLRLPRAAGLGGLVAEAATPYSTASYLRDPRFAHTAEIDAAVVEEGLVAILGVPLRLGSTVIGVLFAANRSERPFRREEVALLASLAAHAAVAIDNARLLQEARTALDELSTANRLVRAHSESVERAAEAHDRLADLVLRGGGVEDVAAALTDVLGGSLLVADADGRTLARVGPDPAVLDADGLHADGLDAGVLADAVAQSRGLGRAVHIGRHAVAAVAAGSEHLGVLVLSGVDQLAGADQRILERAALVTALLLLFRRSVVEAEDRVRGELLEDLLTAADRDPQALADRARRMGVDLDDPHAVVVIAADLPRPRLVAAARRLASDRHGLAGTNGGRVVVLLPHADAGAAARGTAAGLQVALGQPITAGAAGPATGVAGVAAAFAEAVRCLDALVALDRCGSAASMRDLGFLGLVLGDGRDVHGFVRRTIGPLLDYDARRGTALVQTLWEYFRHGSSPLRTRDVLHVHVNTVTQRLDRIGQLIGADWSTPERAVEIQLALRLHRASGG
jgi:sugar diacid utilization regulator